MEFENLELTVEDMLQLHREWITKLYVEEGKTEMEIVELLQERHLFVGPLQVRNCIRDWDLDQATPTSSRLSTSMSIDWDALAPASSSTPVTPASHAPSDPDLIIIYTKRPLPSLPQSHAAARNQRSLPASFHSSTSHQKKRRSNGLVIPRTTHLYQQLDAVLRLLPGERGPLAIGGQPEHDGLTVEVERVRRLTHRRSHEVRVNEELRVRIFRGRRQGVEMPTALRRRKGAKGERDNGRDGWKRD